MTRQYKTIVRGGTFFESPRWHDGRWYVSDIFRSAVVSVAEDGSDLRDFAQLRQYISGSDWLPSGSLLVVLRDRRALAQVDPDGKVAEYASLACFGRGLAGDMVVSRDGCAYVAILGFGLAEFHTLRPGELPPAGLVARVDPDGYTSVAAEGLLSPNGMVIAEDGKTLVVGETLARRYTAFSIEGDGRLCRRRVWAEVSGQPDGCTLDVHGRIWYADASGSRFVLVEEAGSVAAELTLPSGLGGLNAYACMLGGSDGRTLLMCCSPRPGGPEGAAAGSVLISTRVEDPHAGRP